MPWGNAGVSPGTAAGGNGPCFSTTVALLKQSKIDLDHRFVHFKPSLDGIDIGLSIRKVPNRILESVSLTFVMGKMRTKSR